MASYDTLPVRRYWEIGYVLFQVKEAKATAPKLSN